MGSPQDRPAAARLLVPVSSGDPEAHVAGGAARRVTAARRHTIAVAVRLVAEVGATADHLAAFRALGRLEPVGAPLPHVARIVAQAKAVGRERVDRRRPEVAVLERVVDGELPLPDVAAVLAAGGQLVPPTGIASALSRHGPRIPTRHRWGAARPPSRSRRGRPSRRRAPQGGPCARRSRSRAPGGGASPRPRPAATRAPAPRRGSQENRPGGVRRTRTTSQSARRWFGGRSRKRNRRIAGSLRRERRSRGVQSNHGEAVHGELRRRRERTR